MDPTLLPGSPAPCLSVPDMCEEQFRALAVVVSVKVVLPAFALMAPPGLTVQVFAAAAPAGAAAVTARAAAPDKTTALSPARIPIASLIEAGICPSNLG